MGDEIKIIDSLFDNVSVDERARLRVADVGSVHQEVACRYSFVHHDHCELAGNVQMLEGLSDSWDLMLKNSLLLTVSDSVAKEHDLFR